MGDDLSLGREELHQLHGGLDLKQPNDEEDHHRKTSSGNQAVMTDDGSADRPPYADKPVEFITCVVLPCVLPSILA